MKYSLDTNTCIRYINGRSAAVRAKLPAIPAINIVVCSYVVLFVLNWHSVLQKASTRKNL